MATQLSQNRLGPFSLVVLSSLLVLGATWSILNNFKRNHSFGYGTYNHRERNRQNFGSSEDFLDQGCNVFEGKWVLDNLSYPLYRQEDCQFLVSDTSCQRNGRPDTLYQNWKWQPKQCNLPRFDQLELLNILRGKRLMIVGDSLARNQFDSLICLVQSAIPEEKKSLKKFLPALTIFEMEEYNASIYFCWAPFLVESISDNAENHTATERFPHLDSIGTHGESWKEVDILVFDSYAWWYFKPTLRAVYRGVAKEYHFAEAYRLALGTWANWLDSNINPYKQQVYFMSMSPSHWGVTDLSKRTGKCFNKILPNLNLDWHNDASIQIMEVIKDVLQEAKTKVTLLNITQLSQYRIDAHPSIYGDHKGKPLTKEQKANPKKFSDCLHWCLPGVPDIWNEILYAYLFRNYFKSS